MGFPLKSGVMVFLLVLWFIGDNALAQQGEFVETPVIRILPENPTEFDHITVVFEALFSSNCVPNVTFDGPIMQPDQIFYKAESHPPNLAPDRVFTCSAIQTVTGFRSNVGRLLSGEYRVVVLTERFGEIEHSFTVGVDQNEITPNVTVLPANPTEEDIVRVYYSVEYENNCTANITSFKHRLIGFEMQIFVDAIPHKENTQESFVCENVDTKIGFNIELGRLQRGEYSVVAFPGFFGGAKKTFAVSPAPIPSMASQGRTESSRLTIDSIQPTGIDERVLIRNRTDETVDLAGWSLRGNTQKTFEFPKGCSIPPRGVLQVHSGPGNLQKRDRDCFELIWDEGFIWPNDIGGASLISSDGEVISSFSYAGAINSTLLGQITTEKTTQNIAKEIFLGILDAAKDVAFDTTIELGRTIVEFINGECEKGLIRLTQLSINRIAVFSGAKAIGLKRGFVDFATQLTGIKDNLNNSIETVITNDNLNLVGVVCRAIRNVGRGFQEIPKRLPGVDFGNLVDVLLHSLDIIEEGWETVVEELKSARDEFVVGMANILERIQRNSM